MIATVAGDPAPPPAATAVPTGDISFNPDNPRDEIGDVSDLIETFSEVGQIVAITVATVDAYLASRPDRRSELDEGAKYVVIDGHRRLKAAREAGLPTIKFMLGDEFASTDESLLEAAYLANAKRKGLSDLEEAQALKRLVEFYGSQHKAAKRLSMSQPLISQKLSLLTLNSELQADLEAGRRKVSHVRNMGKVPREKQRDEADRRARVEAAKKQKRAAKQHDSAPGGDNSVITPASRQLQARTEPEGDNSVITSETPTPARDDASALPWAKPQTLDQILRERMTTEDRLTLAKLLAQ